MGLNLSVNASLPFMARPVPIPHRQLALPPLTLRTIASTGVYAMKPTKKTPFVVAPKGSEVISVRSPYKLRTPQPPESSELGYTLEPSGVGSESKWIVCWRRDSNLYNEYLCMLCIFLIFHVAVAVVLERQRKKQLVDL